MMERKSRLAGAAALGLLAITGCDPTGPGGDPIEALPRSLSAAEVAVIDGSNVFGLELLRRVVAVDDRANIVLSPLSASMALGMTLNGAAGGTFDAMRGALAFDALSQEQINEGYRDLIGLLRTLDPAVEFSIANSTWANRDWPFHDAFFTTVSEVFDATAETRDFADPATLRAINDWVDEETRGRIDRIIDQLDPDLVLLLINAIYFDGTWTTEFDPDDTAPAPFTRADGSTVQVDMMRLRDVVLPFGGTPDLTAVELPYGGQAFSMVIAVPHERPAREVAAELDAAAWDALVASLQSREVDAVGFPRFTLTYDVFLNEPLADMGMGIAFTDAADFTRLSPRGDELCIDFVRQKTFIEVDEAGTTAAAATAVGIGVVSFTGLIADRPFLFAIRERLSGTILFMGIVGDPTLEDGGPADPADGCAPG